MTKSFRALSRFILVSTVILSVFSCTDSSEQNARQIIEQMTLEQKAQLVVGTGMYFPVPDSLKEMLPIRFGLQEGEETDYSKMVDSIRKYAPGAAGNTAMFPELGITCQVLADGPAGLRISPQRSGEDGTFYCTAFPIATLLASSWDVNLIENVGSVMGNEVLEYGVDVILGPGMNLQRDPLCGRNFEYYSEDPLVTGKMAAAMVKGIQSNGVGTSIKHFAVNNQETNRMSVNTIVSERALRELYLKGFEIAVKEGKPWTVMSSYNKLNGPYTSESHDLLTKILRDDWGFEGYVMTDWGGGSDIVAQMNAGNDMIQPGSPQQVEELISAVEEGKLEETVVDDNTARILKIMFKTPKYNNLGGSGSPDLEKHAEIAREAAANGMVLLKNDNAALPLNIDIETIAAFGNTSYDFISGGTGSGDVNEAYTISLIQGLNNAGLKVDDTLKDIYETYIKKEREKEARPDDPIAAFIPGMIPVEEMELSSELAEEMAANTEIALITIGRNAGEGGDRKAEEGDFYLTPVESGMIKEVSDAFHKQGKKSVVILNIGGVVETASWRDIPDAILCAWQPGQESGNSVVDVLSGKINPSGKLAVSFPLSYDDCPSSANFPGQAVQSDEVDNAPDMSGFSSMGRRPWEVVYEEDIYVGYRYYSTFDKPVAYEFGYGLSYTTFEYGELETTAE
jgi:beta-glucosidase